MDVVNITFKHSYPTSKGVESYERTVHFDLAEPWVEGTPLKMSSLRPFTGKMEGFVPFPKE